MEEKGRGIEKKHIAHILLPLVIRVGSEGGQGGPLCEFLTEGGGAILLLQVFGSEVKNNMTRTCRDLRRSPQYSLILVGCVTQRENVGLSRRTVPVLQLTGDHLCG